METALALGDARSHAAVEALPLPPKAAGKVHPAFPGLLSPVCSDRRRGADAEHACLIQA